MPANSLTDNQLLLLDDPKWRRKNSKWRYVVWWTVGVYGTFALWYVAAKSKTKKSMIAAAVSTVLGVLFMIFTGAQPQLTPAQEAALEGTTRVATMNENLMTASSLALIAFNFWMSFYLQKDWLLWVVTKKGKGSWVEENLNIRTIPRESVNADRTRKAKVDSGSQLFGDASDLIADAPAPVVDQKIEQVVAPQTTGPEEPAVESIDVNQASIGALMKVPGLSEAHAEKILIERKARGGFKSFEELRVTLELKPHEVAKLEGKFEFPSSNSGPAFGRVLDV